MLGQMMTMPLLTSSLLVHAERHHPEQEVVTRRVEGDLHRYRYTDLAARSRQLAKALGALGIGPSDRVGTLAWNTYRHMELYYAASGIQAVLHTINPRLHADQLVYIANHAEDRVLFFDLSFMPLVQAIAPRLSSVRAFVLMTDRAHMPEVPPIEGLLCYEDLLAAQTDDFDWPVFDELEAATLCYTSGTTGNPKGVLFSHRSTLLHCLAGALPDSIGVSAVDSLLPVVPMFHVNAWGLPYIACMTGAKLVFPGPNLDAKSLHTLIEGEGVTLSAGVPTVWQTLLAHMEAQGLKFSTMRRTMIGGSACPPAMIRTFVQTYGVRVVHAWGMTELSPIGTLSTFKPKHLNLTADEQLQVMAKQGRVPFGVDMRVVDGAGQELPRDGLHDGELQVRGHWVVSQYFKSEGGDPLSQGPEGGWFPTGDVARIDGDGYLQITDRSKDVIKSGGEWIGSIDLENVAMSHPAVAMAACIAAHHPKWEERPLLVVVTKPGASVSREALLAFYEGRVAKWWIPDDVVFVDSLPLGATGKMLKHRLREQFRDHRLPTA